MVLQMILRLLNMLLMVRLARKLEQKRLILKTMVIMEEKNSHGIRMSKIQQRAPPKPFLCNLANLGPPFESVSRQRVLTLAVEIVIKRSQGTHNRKQWFNHQTEMQQQTHSSRPRMSQRLWPPRSNCRPIRHQRDCEDTSPSRPPRSCNSSLNDEQ